MGPQSKSLQPVDPRMKLVYPLLAAVALLATGTDAAKKEFGKHYGKWCIKGVRERQGSRDLSRFYPDGKDGNQPTIEERAENHRHAAAICNDLDRLARTYEGEAERKGDLCVFEPGHDGIWEPGQIQVYGHDALIDACDAKLIHLYLRGRRELTTEDWTKDREIANLLCDKLSLKRKQWGYKGDCKAQTGVGKAFNEYR